MLVVTHSPQVAARGRRPLEASPRPATRSTRTAVGPAGLRRARGRDRPHAGGRPDHRRGPRRRQGADECLETAADQLTEAEAEAELQRLADAMARADALYYQQEAPEISDADYDALKRP